MTEQHPQWLFYVWLDFLELTALPRLLIPPENNIRLAACLSIVVSKSKNDLLFIHLFLPPTIQITSSNISVVQDPHVNMEDYYGARRGKMLAVYTGLVSCTMCAVILSD